MAGETSLSDCIIVQPIAQSGIDLLRKAGLDVFVSPSPELEAFRSELVSASAVITRNAGFSAEAIAAAPRLLVIGSHGTGTNMIDRDAASTRGIVIVNTPGANAQSVAELVIALLLACARGIPAADLAVRDGDNTFRVRRSGIELHGRALGLVGFGHIARLVSRLGAAFGMKVNGWSRRASLNEMHAAGITPVSDLDTLLATSDVISLHSVALGPPLLDATRLGMIKPGAILINTARGTLVDENELARLLVSGHLAGAGLDVFAVEPLSTKNPLFGAPNLVLTPHIGGTTLEALDRTGIEVARRVMQALGLDVPANP